MLNGVKKHLDELLRKKMGEIVENAFDVGRWSESGYPVYPTSGGAETPRSAAKAKVKIDKSNYIDVGYVDSPTGRVYIENKKQ